MAGRVWKDGNEDVAVVVGVEEESESSIVLVVVGGSRKGLNCDWNEGRVSFWEEKESPNAGNTLVSGVKVVGLLSDGEELLLVEEIPFSGVAEGAG